MKEQRERAISLLQKAKALCLVSRALATAQKFEARVEIKARSAGAQRLEQNWKARA